MEPQKGFARLTVWVHDHPRLVDFFSYIVICLTLVTALVIAMVKGASWETISKGVYLAFVAMVFLTLFIKDSKLLWKSARFWIFLSCFLAVSLTILLVVLTHVKEIPLKEAKPNVHPIGTAFGMYLGARYLRDKLFSTEPRNEPSTKLPSL